MKTIIALNGPSQSGKTQTLKLFLQFIKKETEKNIYKSKKWKECLEVNVLDDLKIGVTSRSDKIQKLRENIEFLINEMDCDVVVTAINTKTKGVTELLEDLKARNIEIEMVEKFPEFCNRAQKGLQLDLNLQAAKILWTRLKQLEKIEIDQQQS